MANLHILFFSKHQDILKCSHIPISISLCVDNEWLRVKEELDTELEYIGEANVLWTSLSQLYN